MSETPEDEFVVIDVEALWNRNFNALRESRELQKRIQALGVLIPIQHLLVIKKSLSRELAWEGEDAPPPSPGKLPYAHREDAVITAAISSQTITTDQVVAAQKVLDGMGALGVRATLSYALVGLGHVTWEDLAQLDAGLGGGPETDEDAVPVLDASPAGKASAKPGSGTVKKPSGVVKPSGVKKPGSGVTKPGGGETKPGGSTVPSSGATKPGSGTTKPGGAAKPAGGVTKPSSGVAKPSGAPKPGSGVVKPGGASKPGSGVVKPGGGTKPSSLVKPSAASKTPARPKPAPTEPEEE